MCFLSAAADIFSSGVVMYDRLLSVNPKVSVIHRSALTDWMRMKHRCRERFTNIKTSEHELHRIPCLGFEASVRITCEYLKLSRLVVIIHLEYSGVVIVCLDAFKTSQVKWWASELWAVVDTMGWAGADQKRSLAGFYCTYTSPFLTLFFCCSHFKTSFLGMSITTTTEEASKLWSIWTERRTDSFIFSKVKFKDFLLHI